MADIEDLRQLKDATENWTPIPGYEGSYEVSDLGRVRSLDRVVKGPGGFPKRVKGTMLSPSTHPTGYKRVSLAKGGENITRGVHQLVMLAFVGARPEGMEVCHNDGNPANTRLENLRYDTLSANQREIVTHGRNEKANRTHCPRGHILAMPNLVPSQWKKGHRECLSCSRARNHIRQKGISKDALKVVGDLYFEALGGSE